MEQMKQHISKIKITWVLILAMILLLMVVAWCFGEGDIIANAIGLTPDKIVSGNTILGVEGTGVKLFNSMDEMNADATANEGDLALVYGSNIQNATADSVFSVATFPQTVVLPEAVTDYVDLIFRAVDDSEVFDCWGQLDSYYFMMDCYTKAGSIRIQYESNDGITYNRTELAGDGVNGDSVDFGIEIKYIYSDMWDDSIGYFIQTGGKTFEGLFEYKEDTDLVYFTSSKGNEICLPANPKIIMGYNTWDMQYRGAVIKVDTVDDAGRMLTGQLYYRYGTLNSLWVSGDGTNILCDSSEYSSVYLFNIEVDWLNHTFVAPSGTRETLPIMESSYCVLCDANAECIVPLDVMSNDKTSKVIPVSECITKTKYIYADTQLNAYLPSDVITDKTVYGKNGVITGDGTIYEHLEKDKVLKLVFGFDKQIAGNYTVSNDDYCYGNASDIVITSDEYDYTSYLCDADANTATDSLIIPYKQVDKSSVADISFNNNASPQYMKYIKQANKILVCTGRELTLVDEHTKETTVLSAPTSGYNRFANMKTFLFDDALFILYGSYNYNGWNGIYMDNVVSHVCKLDLNTFAFEELYTIDCASTSNNTQPTFYGNVAKLHDGVYVICTNYSPTVNAKYVLYNNNTGEITDIYTYVSNSVSTSYNRSLPSIIAFDNHAYVLAYVNEENSIYRLLLRKISFDNYNITTVVNTTYDSDITSGKYAYFDSVDKQFNDEDENAIYCGIKGCIINKTGENAIEFHDVYLNSEQGTNIQHIGDNYLLANSKLYHAPDKFLYDTEVFRFDCDYVVNSPDSRSAIKGANADGTDMITTMYSGYSTLHDGVWVYEDCNTYGIYIEGLFKLVNVSDVDNYDYCLVNGCCKLGNVDVLSILIGNKYAITE